MSLRFPAAYLPLVLMLTLTPAVARAQIDEPRIPLQTKMTELNRFRTEYAENFNKHDAAAVAAMFAADGSVIAPNGAVFTGNDQITQYLLQGTRDIPHIIIASDSTVVYGNTAIDLGKTTAHPAAGGEMVTRYLVVLNRDMNGWKIVRLSSTPIQS
jgi:ketosteroid isomerase-like protein